MADKMEFSDVKFEDVSCPLGCTRGDAHLVTGKDRLHHLPGAFSVVQCKTCGLMRTHPRPTEETISFYYPEGYGPYLGTVIPAGSREKDSDSLVRKAIKGIFQFNTGRIPDMPPGRMLEIGCASGSFLAHMADRGWDVSGIELSRSAAQRARRLGYSVHCGSISSAPDPAERYDLIVGWMVFEHLHHPLQELERFRRWLNDDGVLVLSVPNAGSFEFRWFKDAWFALQMPTHLYHYTPETIRMVLERGGFILTRLFHQRLLSNIFKSLGNRLADQNAPPGFCRFFYEFPEKGWKRHYVLYPLAFFLGLLGQSGRMTVWAKRKR